MRAALQLRIEATLVNEACWLLAEGGVSAQAIDTAMKSGLNFPRGPFEVLARQGAAAVVGELRRLQGLAPPELRARYDLAPELEKA